MGLALIVLSLSCCEKEQKTEVQPYLWNINTKVFTGINPVYFNESYFIFPTNYQLGEMYLLRVDERTGDTIYNVQLLGLDDNLSNSNAKAYVDDDELHIILDRNFYKIEIETGQIITRYDFPNFLWKSNVQDQNIYTCSYSSLEKFYFAYFDKDIGEQHVVYSAELNGNETDIIGHAPIVNGNSLILPLSKVNSNVMENQLIQVGPDTTISVLIDFTDNWVGGPVFDDEVAIYLYMVDKMVAYRKSDLSVLWELETVVSGSGPYHQTEDKIYMGPSREIEVGDANIMYIIDKKTGGYKTVESPACLGHLERVGDFIYYVGWGDFMKFDMISEEFIPAKGNEKSRTAYQPIWGISPNSKILFDDEGWHCFPL